MTDISRFSRQILLAEIGADGQQKLCRSSVIVLGAGGLGCPVLEYLAAAGIGRITAVDGDTVSITNLNRQILYGEKDLGKPKAEVAAERITEKYSDIQIIAQPIMLQEQNAAQIIAGHDLALFCLDSIPARKIANRACVLLGVPFVDAAVQAFSGALFSAIPDKTACYECLYPQMLNIPQPIPILGAMVGFVGALQALSAVRMLLNLPEPSLGKYIYIDGQSLAFEHVDIRKNADCPVCGRS